MGPICRTQTSKEESWVAYTQRQIFLCFIGSNYLAENYWLQYGLIGFGLLPNTLLLRGLSEKVIGQDLNAEKGNQ